MEELLSLKELQGMEINEGFTPLDMFIQVYLAVTAEEEERKIQEQQPQQEFPAGGATINESTLNGKLFEGIHPCWSSKKRRGTPATEDQEEEEEEESCIIQPKRQKKKRSNIVGVEEEVVVPDDLPETYKNFIRDVNGSDCKLIIQKRLTKTDVNPNETRLLISINKIKNDDFIDEEEKEYLCNKCNDDGKCNTIKVKLIEPDDNGVKERSDYVHLRRWKMEKKKSGKVNYYYALAHTWNKIVKENELKKNDVIQLYSFRVDGVLYFALVIVEKAIESTTSSPEEDNIVEGNSSSSAPIEAVPEGASSGGRTTGEAIVEEGVGSGADAES